MAVNEKRYGYYAHLRDVRPIYVRLAEWFKNPKHSFLTFFALVLPFYFIPQVRIIADLILLVIIGFFWWLKTRKRPLPFKHPMDSPFPDPTNMTAGRSGKPEGILYL